MKKRIYIVTAYNGVDLARFNTLKAARVFSCRHFDYSPIIEVHATGKGLLYKWKYNANTLTFKKMV